MNKTLLPLILVANMLWSTTINVPGDYATIQSGIDAASDGDTVLVQPGTYLENINYNGKNIVVGSLMLTTSDTSYISQTVINGSGSDVVTIENEEGESTVLTGFSIVNGNTGIRCTGSSPLLNNLIIRDMAGYSIGVRVRYDAFVRLRNSEIHNNKIGVLVISTGNLVAESLKIHHNTNESDGGAGLYVNSNVGSDIPAIATISHSIFHNNTGTYSGAIKNEGQLWLTNVTISQNVATFEGASGGIWQATQLDYSPDPGEEAIVHMRNCILYGNTPTENYEIQDNNGFRPTCWDLDYNNIEISTFPDHCYYQIGDSNQYNIDPLFVDADNYDFNLLDNSPCIDAGDPDLDDDGEDYTTDEDDQDPDGTRLDMGAYYYQEPAPIVSISSSEFSPTNASPIPITVTFSIDVTGFEEGDVSVDNGSISDFSGSGSSYSFDITPSGDGAVTVDIPENVAQDDEGNSNLAAQQFSITYDGTSPTVSISSSATSPTETSPIPIAVDFNEDVIGFTLDDVTITNGSISDLSGSGSSYSISLTPAGDGGVTVDIASDVVQDAAGNGNTEASQFSIFYDSNMFTDHFDDLTGWTNTTNSLNPNEEWYIDGSYLADFLGTAARSDVGGYTYGDQLSRSFTFNSEVKVSLWVKTQVGDAVKIYFMVDDVERWVFGEFGDPGSTWVQKEITIAEGTHTISIETDFAGWAWIDELEIETNSAPVATITSSYGSPTNSSSIPIEVNFSKDVTGFEEGDVSVDNGSISDFSGTGQSYSFNITPSGDGTVTVDIAENVAQDDDGNGNLAAQQFSITYDGTSPTVSISSSGTSPTHSSPIVAEIVFTEPVLNFEQGDVGIANGSVSAFSGADSLYDVSIIPDGDGTVRIFIADNIAFDPAGNGNLASDTLEIYYDDLPPIVDVDDISEAGTMDTLTITWVSTDVSVLDKHILYLTNDGQNYSLLDSTAGEVLTYEWAVPNVLYDQNRISVQSIDEWGLVSGDTTNVFAIIDNDPPVVTALEPTGGSTIPEYDSLAVEWTATDNIGVDSVQVFYSNDGGMEYVLMGSLASPTVDSLVFEVPAGVTSSAKVRILALDARGNSGYDESPEFTVTDNTPPQVALIGPSTENDLDIGSPAMITWSASDNVNVESVTLEYTADNINWNMISDGEINDGEFEWIVPDEPSNQVSLRVIAFDGIGLSDTSEISGYRIVITYPTAASVSPEALSWVDNSITVQFSQYMQPSTITSENIVLNANYSGAYFDELLYIDSTQSVVLSFSSALATLDTLSLTISGNNVTNIYGYQLDGNNDGVGGDDITFNYFTSMLADYDSSYSIELNDMAAFIQNWSLDNTLQETGPFLGEIPHVSVTPDGSYNIDDLMGFVMSGNWYFDTNGLLFARYPDNGLIINTEINKDSLWVSIPENSLVYEIQLKYDPNDLSFILKDEVEEIRIVNRNDSDGLLTIMAENYDFETLPIQIVFNSRKPTIGLEMSMRSINADLVEDFRATKSLTIENIPDEFALFHNYPNPFNPTTKIEYALPKESHVYLAVYDILGRQVKTLVNSNQSQGYKSVKWSGRNNLGQHVSAGMYFYRIQAGSFSKVKKMVLLK